MRLRRRALGLTFATVGAVMALGAANASAAVEFGSSCVGDSKAPGDYTITGLVAPGASVPLTAPSAGVVTKVTSNLDNSYPPAFPVAVKILHTATETTLTATAESDVSLAPGVVSRDLRLPVQAGDRIGLRGLPFTLEGVSEAGITPYCESTTTGTILGAVGGNVSVGASATFNPVTEGSVPVVATLEPDADADGYGDETQDGCPQSAAAQSSCPRVVLKSTKQVTKDAVIFSVTSAISAKVTVKGTAPLGKGKKVTIKAGSKTVGPGTITKFKLRFPRRLKDRLAELPPSKRVSVKVTMSAPNLVGKPTKKTLTVKVRGEG